MMLSLAATAQAPTGTITGQVKNVDPNLPPIVGANVRIIRSDGSDYAQFISEESGRFFVDSVPEGRYTVAVSTNGATVTDVCMVKPGENCDLVFEF